MILFTNSAANQAYDFPNPSFLLGMMSIGSTLNLTGSAGKVYLNAVYLPHPVLATAINFTQQTLGGIGTSFRVGMYSDNGDTPVGGALLFDSGNLPADSATGLKVTTLPTPIQLQKGKVWICVQTEDGVIQLLRHTNVTMIGGASPLNGCTFTQTFGAFPSTCPAVTTNGIRLTCGIEVSTI